MKQSPLESPRSELSLDLTRGKSYGVEHILSPVTGHLSEILREVLGLSPSRTEFLLQYGSIYRHGRRLPADATHHQIQSGDYLRVHQNPRRFPSEVFDFKQSLIWENQDLTVIHKPAGLPVHPTVDNTQENILALMEKAIGQKYFVTHRLDVATEGLLVLAKNSAAQAQMNTLLMNNQVQKIYRAYVQSPSVDEIPLGDITHFMEPSPRAPKTVSPDEKPGWQICRLRILSRKQMGEKTGEGKTGTKIELTIELLTGRTHQIRAQLSALGFPICGDRAYGSQIGGESSIEKISLQAYSLKFPWNNELISLNLPVASP